MNTEAERLARLAVCFAEILARLAACSWVQRDYLSRIGASPSTDELALELDGIWPALRSFASPALIAVCDELDATLGSFSGMENEALWYVDALDEPQWAAVRLIAARAVAEFHRERMDRAGYFDSA